MSEDDRERWNARHARASGPAAEPDAIVRRAAAHVRGGFALDVASGRGRHALWLARAGFDVLAVDVSDVALGEVSRRAAAESLAVRTERRDVSVDGLPPGEHDLVLVTRFLDRSLFPSLRRAVRVGGCLVVETFTTAHADRTGFRRDLCLEPGELVRAFGDWVILEAREGRFDGADLAGIVVRRASPDGSR